MADDASGAMIRSAILWERACSRFGRCGQSGTPRRGHRGQAHLPQALRLKYLQVLKPEWSSRLTVEYLSRIMPALDIGGAYEQQINLAFYGRAAST